MLKTMVLITCFVNFYVQAMEIEMSKQQIEKNLFEAIENGDYASFTKAIKNGVNPNAQEFRGRRALGYTISHYYQSKNNTHSRVVYLDMIETLLKNGADPNIYCDDTIESDIVLLGSDSSMARQIANLPNFSYMYDIVVLLLQYGIDKDELYSIIFFETNADALKIVLLTNPKQTENDFKDCGQPTQRLLETCRKEIQLDQEALAPIINSPKNADKKTLLELQKEARLNMQELKIKKNIIKKCGGILGYLKTYAITGRIPQKSTLMLESSKKRDIKEITSPEAVGAKRFKEDKEEDLF